MRLQSWLGKRKIVATKVSGNDSSPSTSGQTGNLPIYFQKLSVQLQNCNSYVTDFSCVHYIYPCSFFGKHNIPYI